MRSSFAVSAGSGFERKVKYSYVHASHIPQRTKYDILARNSPYPRKVSYLLSHIPAALRKINVEVELIGLELHKKLAELGLGVSLLSQRFVAEEIRRGNLKTLHVIGEKLQAYSCLVFRSDKYLHGAMRASLRLLEESFRPTSKALQRILE